MLESMGHKLKVSNNTTICFEPGDHSEYIDFEIRPDLFQNLQWQKSLTVDVPNGSSQILFVTGGGRYLITGGQQLFNQRQA
jgi:hypothetical protein